MSVTEHPNYQEEKQKLQETVNYIEDFIARQKTPIMSQGATSWSAVSLSQIRLKELEKMKLAQQEPYVGRVDVQFVDADQPESLYIGKQSIPDMGVFNWQGTKAADYYFKRKSDDQGKLLLKRTFTIERDTLRRIVDEFVDPELADRLDITVDEFTDQLLVKLLMESRGSQLHDIVATIQQQQYQIIQSPLEQLLVVQGVPGSGKTQIALHRVSYLLYHHQDDKRMVPNRVLILGPNPIFMRYIGNVLPALGNRRLLQRTFDDWLLERLGDTLNYETQDDALESLLGQNLEQAERIMHYRNAQVKGSLRMAQVLEKYVAWLHEQVLDGRADFVCEVRIRGQRWGPITLSLEQIRGFLDATRQLPFNLRREEVERQLLRHIFQKMTGQTLPRETDDDLQKQIRDAINDQLRDYFSDWPRQNVLIAYRRLLRNVEFLRQASEGILDIWEQELLVQDAPTARVPFRFSDLAALLYFKLLMDGKGDTSYDYIVVDEAQDLTPLHFKVLFEHSRDGAMTVLGDLAQSIYPHHRLNSWDDLSIVAPDITPQVETIRQSYRSTRQITDFANDLLKRSALSKDHWAAPIARDGATPQKKVFPEKTALIASLPKIIREELDNGHQSIALVAKTVSACKAVAEALTQLGFNDYELIDDRNAIYKGGVVIIPAYLTKGLEFDSLILTDADELTYPPDHLHAHLLYVVVTRAAHALHIYWTGTLTPMLDEAPQALTLSPFLSNYLGYDPVTIATYVQHQSAYTMDWCVERLAGADKLNLLKGGRIDHTLLDILLKGFTTTTTPLPAQPDDMFVPSLSDPLIRSITNQTINLATSPEQPSVAQALILSQVVFNLLRNYMRRAGLSLPEERLPTLPEQMVGLVTLFKALEEGKINLNAGRWTTRKRALNGFGGDKQDGERLLQQLIQHGIVEEKADSPQIRVFLQQIEPLLALALGRSTSLSDESFLDEIQTLPDPIIVVQEGDTSE